MRAELFLQPRVGSDAVATSMNKDEDRQFLMSFTGHGSVKIPAVDIRNWELIMGKVLRAAPRYRSLIVEALLD